MHQNSFLVLELQYCTRMYRVKFAQLPHLNFWLCKYRSHTKHKDRHLQTVAVALDDNMDGFVSTGVHHSEFHSRNLDHYMHR